MMTCVTCNVLQCVAVCCLHIAFTHLCVIMCSRWLIHTCIFWDVWQMCGRWLIALQHTATHWLIHVIMCSRYSFTHVFFQMCDRCVAVDSLNEWLIEWVICRTINACVTSPERVDRWLCRTSSHTSIHLSLTDESSVAHPVRERESTWLLSCNWMSRQITLSHI